MKNTKIDSNVVEWLESQMNDAELEAADAQCWRDELEGELKKYKSSGRLSKNIRWLFNQDHKQELKRESQKR